MWVTSNLLVYCSREQEVFTLFDMSLTLGAHAQRGLRYLVSVSVSVCVCYQFFCHHTLQCAQKDIPSASAGHKKCFKFGFFFKSVSCRNYSVKKPIAIK